MVHYIEGFLQLIDDIDDGADLAVNYSYLRGMLNGFYVAGCITKEEYEHYNNFLLKKEHEKWIWQTNIKF